MKRYFFFFAVLLFAGLKADAQKGYNERARKYVEDYCDYAIEEQMRVGIPAAITLGQGILETEAGASELVVNANNHFGIKCKSDWTGETYAHDDDAPGECFKKYGNALESYKDHSSLLTRNPRYAPLFSIPITNYQKWAMTLRKCGYATSPTYGQKLTKIIEEFGLQHYTLVAQNKKAKGENVMMARDEAGQKTQKPAETTPQTAALTQKPAEVKPQTAAVIQKPAEAKPQTAALTQPMEAARPMQVIQASYHQELEDTPKVQKQVTETPKPTKADTPAAAPKPEGTSPLSKIADSARAFIDSEQEEPAQAAAPPDTSTSKTTMVNGLKAIYVRKGEQLLSYAVKYNIRYALLLEMNDLTDAPMPFDGYVYLQRKLTTGKNAKHTVLASENLLMVSQSEAIQLKRLMALNKLYPGEEPAPGTVLELQNTASAKPALRAGGATAAHTQNAIGGMMKVDTSRTGNRIQGVMRPGDPAKPAAVATKPTRPENKIPVDSVYTVNDPRDYGAMHWAASDTVKAPGKKADEHKGDEAELAKLKADLDKIVYSDGSAPPSGGGSSDGRTPATPVAGTYYMVRKGDTAYSIAKTHGITVQQLLKWNNIEPADIKPGKTLRVGE